MTGAIGCSWTSHVKTFEICSNPEYPTTIWPFNSEGFELVDIGEGDDVQHGVLSPAGPPVLENAWDLIDVVTGFGYPYPPPLNVTPFVLPVTEVWGSRLSHNRSPGFPAVFAQVIIRVGGGQLAEDVDFTATRVSGEVLDFFVDELSGFFALVSFRYTPPTPFVDYFSTYDVHVGDVDLRINLRLRRLN